MLDVRTRVCVCKHIGTHTSLLSMCELHPRHIIFSPGRPSLHALFFWHVDVGEMWEREDGENKCS